MPDVLEMPPVAVDDETDEQGRQRRLQQRQPLTIPAPANAQQPSQPQTPAQSTPSLPPVQVSPQQPAAPSGAPAITPPKPVMATPATQSTPSLPPVNPPGVNVPGYQNGAPQLHGWKKAADVIASMFPIGRAVETAIPGTPQNFDLEQQKAMLRASKWQEAEKSAAETDEVKARTESLRNPSPKTAPEPKTVDTGDGVFQFNEDTGRYDIKIGPSKTADKGSEYKSYTVPGSDAPVMARQVGDKLLGRDGKELAANAVPFEKPAADSGKLSAEIEAQIGAKPTTATFGGKTYPSPQAAQAAWGKEAERIKNEEAGSAADARGKGFGRNRPVEVLDTYNGNRPIRVSAGEQEDNPDRYINQSAGVQAASKDKQFADIDYAADKARAAINGLDKPMNAFQIAKLEMAMRETDPGVFNTEIDTMLGSQKLTEPQQDFVTWIAQLHERAMSLRSIAGMGQGSESLRQAIIATLPGIKSGDKQLMLKQLDAFQNQAKILSEGVPNIKPQGEGAPKGTGKSWNPASGKYE